MRVTILAICASTALATPGTLQLDFNKRTVSNAAGLSRRTLNAPLENGLLENVERYIVDFSIGTPPQDFSLVLDTGSSDIWVPWSSSPGCTNGACVHTFDPSQSSTIDYTGSIYNNTYGIPGQEVSTVGEYFTDTLHIGGVDVTGMTMAGVNVTADVVQDLGAIIGILGVGPASGEAIVDEAFLNGSATDLQQAEAFEFPTIYDQLVDLGISSRRAFSLWLNDATATAGSILFGGIDSAKYTGDLVSLPILLDDAYAVALTSVTMSSQEGHDLLTADDFAIFIEIDSGTPTMALPVQLVQSVAAGLGAVNADGQYYVGCQYREIDATLDFGFGGEGGLVIKVPFSAFILSWTATGNVTLPNGDEVCLLGMAADTTPLPGYPQPFTLGDTFMRSAYVVYDIDNGFIAMGQAAYGASSAVTAIPSGTALPGVSSTNTYTIAVASGTAVPTAAVSTLAAPSAASVTPTAFASPTFNLGTSPAAITAGSATGAAASSASSTGSSSNAGVKMGPASSGMGLLAVLMALGM